MILRNVTIKPRLNSAFKQLMSIHWIMASCYLLMFTTGTFMANLSGKISFRGELYDFHKAMGVLVMGILTWRILILLQVWWRKYTRSLPKFSREWMQKFLLHSTLYLFMFALPVSGFFFSNSYKNNNVHFLGFTLPDIFPQNSALVDLGRSLHFWLAYTFLAFILLHIIAQRKVVRANWRRFQGMLRANWVARK